MVGIICCDFGCKVLQGGCKVLQGGCKVLLRGCCKGAARVTTVSRETFKTCVYNEMPVSLLFGGPEWVEHENQNIYCLTCINLEHEIYDIGSELNFS